ncbi:hypothetical protein U9M48_028957, partial [Paspalum notatum var. saurae]
MNPDLKYLLNEMTKRFDDQDALLVQHLVDHDSKLEQRLVDRDGIIDQRLSDLDSKWAHRFETFSTDTEGRVSNIEAAAANFEEWRHEVEASVDDMHLEVKKLSKHWDRAVMDQPASGPGIMGASPSAAARPPSGSTVDLASGHRQQSHNGVDGFGVDMTLDPHPVKGHLLQPLQPSLLIAWQPLPVPDTAWQVISMDFVEGLPLSGRADCILVVVDFFTKYTHFIPLHHPYTAPSVAQQFLHHVYRLHGLPATIVTDWDKIFTSHFWRELFRLAGVNLNMTFSYHPQSDGQTERLNQTMETYLRCFVNACPSKWIQWISQAEYWYNTSPHSAIGRSPFEALYGYKPRHFGISASDAVTSPDIHAWLQERPVMTDLIRQHLVRSRHRMKKQADKHISDRQFQVGDSVLVKLQPYIQTSLARRSNQKLAFKYFGTYEVLSHIGSAAYRLKLPSYSSIHPVFHVSQLKPFVPSSSQVLPQLPDDLSLPRVPARVLQTWTIKKRRALTDQVLVQWSGWPPELATREDLISLKQTFPFAPAWGQAASQGRGNVSNQNDQEEPTEDDTRTEE